MADAPGNFKALSPYKIAEEDRGIQMTSLEKRHDMGFDGNINKFQLSDQLGEPIVQVRTGTVTTDDGESMKGTMVMGEHNTYFVEGAKNIDDFQKGVDSNNHQVFQKKD